MLNKFTYWFYLLVLSLCISGCQSCKKKEPTPEYNFRIPQELYDYAYFKPGTYWVYEDSITHMLDSVYIYKASDGVKTYAEQTSEHYKGSFGWFSCWMHSTYDQYDYEHWVDQTWEVNGSPSTVNNDKDHTPNSGYNTGSTILIANINVGTQLTTYPDYVKYITSYENFSLNTYTFSSVQKWFNSKSAVDDRQNANYYIARHIGIIRKELNDSNRTWNLLRYHIVQ